MGIGDEDTILGTRMRCIEQKERLVAELERYIPLSEEETLLRNDVVEETQFKGDTNEVTKYVRGMV